MTWTTQLVKAGTQAERMQQLRPGGPTGLLGTTAGGSLWALSPGGLAARHLADGLDAATPIAAGHGRVAGRTTGGGLWVWEAGRSTTQPNAALAEHAGLLVLPQAVVGVVVAEARAVGHISHRLARFEPAHAGRWQEVARSQDAVLPDARPLQADLDGRGDGGHIVVLAGPDGARYAHGALGDGIEATRLLWLERHDLQVLRALDLPAPHVFEDIAPRPVVIPGVPGSPGFTGLLTVRSGPEGGQLALVTADAAHPEGLRVAALGDPVGGFHRWLAPSTDGQRLAAVHTPHIGGALHSYALEYRRSGLRLNGRQLVNDVSTHRIGSRELDLSVWFQGLLILPSQDGRRLRVLDPAADWAERTSLKLPGQAVMTTALTDPPAIAVLLDDGQVVVARPQAR
jgi:hypothetical protein